MNATLKVKHRRGFQGIFALRAAPVLDFGIRHGHEIKVVLR